MRACINDCMRWLIGHGIAGLGLLAAIVQRIQLGSFFRRQEQLRARYQVVPDMAVLPFGPVLERLLTDSVSQLNQNVRFAVTSGSTSSPKIIPVSRKRLRAMKLTYSRFFASCCRAWSIRRKSLYIFAPLSGDDSLTSLLLEEARLPPYLVTLQAPYRVQCDSTVQFLASTYGATALRVWLLAIANPGVLYATNPSTISTFLDDLNSNWQRSTRLVKDFCSQSLAVDVGRIVRRLDSRGSKWRLRQIAESRQPIPLQGWAPGVEACLCWTGGYVQPFIDRLRHYLPAERYRLLPMYSMSTETIETVGYFDRGTMAFLPLAGGVLYEFIEEGAEDRPENLLRADQLKTGRSYAMVVSDASGLRRYQTGDLFLCAGHVKGLPDLRFLRRRDLEYSFTGEKITAQQVLAVFQRLRQENPWLRADDFLTCVPSQPAGEPVPHYKIVLIGPSDKIAEPCAEPLARRCDTFLAELNCEYESKRKGGRLGPVRFVCRSAAGFFEEVGGAATTSSGLDGQFKLMPLYRRTWEKAGVRG